MSRCHINVFVSSPAIDSLLLLVCGSLPFLLCSTILESVVFSVSDFGLKYLVADLKMVLVKAMLSLLIPYSGDWTRMSVFHSVYH